MYIRKDSKTITCTSSGVGSGSFSTVLNGLVHGFRVSINKAVGAGSKIDITTKNSTNERILQIADPSTLGVFYYPRAAACNTTGNSTTPLDQCRMLHNDICNILVAAGTSAIAAGTTTVMPIVTVDIYVK